MILGNPVTLATKAYSFQGWLNAGGVTGLYASLSDVLNDQVAVRRLMTIHASVDYLAEWFQYDNTVLTTIMNSAYGAKWLGLRDYACDKFMNSTAATNIMLSSSNWEYILKDHAPIMTGASSPYCKITSSGNNSSGQFNEYCAFNGNSIVSGAYGGWISSTLNTAAIKIEFVQPIMVRRIKIRPLVNDETRIRAFHIDGGDTGASTDWTTLFSGECEKLTDLTYLTFDIPNSKYYKFYRLTIDSSWTSSSSTGIGQWKLFGRALNVSVPVMTSNTAPWGTTTVSSTYSSSYPGWNAFNGSVSGYGWLPNSSDSFGTANLTYEFEKPCCIKKLYVRSYSPTASSSTNGVWKFQASADGSTFVDLNDAVSAPSNNTDYLFDIDNDLNYKYYRMLYISASSLASGDGWHFQFFGLDYTEREFESGSTMHYIYDHGVELEPVEIVSSSGNSGTKENDYIKQIKTSSQDASTIGTMVVTSNPINTASYSLIRAAGYASCRIERLACLTSKVINFTISVPYRVLNLADYENNLYIDISSVDGIYYICDALAWSSEVGNTELRELWLE